MGFNFVKLFHDDLYQGELKDTPLDLVGFWVKLLVLSSDKKPEYRGTVGAHPTAGYTVQQLGKLIGCSTASTKKYLEMLKERRLIELGENDLIKICNWEKYQSDYDRQKPLRDVAKEIDKICIENPDDKLTKAIVLYQDKISRIKSSVELDKLDELITQYPYMWFEDAITEAAEHNAHNLAYVNTILENWKANGRGNEAKEQARKQASAKW